MIRDDSVLLPKKDLPSGFKSRGADYYSNLVTDEESQSNQYNRDHLRVIVEEY